jgi:hypothetical protein
MFRYAHREAGVGEQDSSSVERFGKFHNTEHSLPICAGVSAEVTPAILKMKSVPGQ